MPPPIRQYVISLFTAALFTIVAPAAAIAAMNPVQAENALPGDTAWELYPEAQGEIEGYASATSVTYGDSISFYVSTTSSNYSIAIFRLGWYNGVGGRRMTPTAFRNGIVQPVPSPQPGTGLIECNWTDPYTITIPSQWVSGMYAAKITAGATGRNKLLVFAVRDEERITNHLFVSSTNTGQAYNSWGGKSLYGFNSTGGVAAKKVSYNRPYKDGAGTGDFLLNWEFNMVRFLEREGYDVSYATDVDLHRRPSLLLRHKHMMIVGHGEYWSWEMRAGAESALAAGVNLSFFAGNSVYWQVRFEPSSAGVLDRTIVSHKETALSTDPYALDSDPNNDRYITRRWRDAPVNRPEEALIGVQYIYDPLRPGEDIVVENTGHWVYANTGLSDGDRLFGLLGYEVDAIGPSSPANVVRLAHSPFLNTKTNQTNYSDMSIYSTTTGTPAMVFATGTIQWSWGLDNWNEFSIGDRVQPAVQQITRNVLARFAGTTASLDCLYRLSPASTTPGSAGGTFNVNVSASIGCTWSAAPSVPWITIASGGSGNGAGTVSYNVAQNLGPARSGTITIGDAVLTVSQSGGCTISIFPTSVSVSSAAANGSISLTASTSSCPWTVTSSAGWLSATPPDGTGSGSVSYSIQANNGPARTATLTIGPNTFTVNQASGCTYSVTPATTNFPMGGGSSSVSVSTVQGCFWTSSTSSSWITITSATEVNGSGSVSFSVAANNGASRRGTLVVAGQAITIEQAGVPCNYSISPTSANAASEGGSSYVVVNAPSGCAWIASGNSFVTITSGESGTGPGTVWYSVAPNNGSAQRSGTIVVAGIAVTIRQSGLSSRLRTVRGDTNGDGRADLFWRNPVTGENAIWLSNGFVPSGASISSVPDVNWRIVGTGDFDGDAKADLLWRNQSTGQNVIWLINRQTVTDTAHITPVTAANWDAAGIGDFDGDGKSDILWRNQATGESRIWLMNGFTVVNGSALPIVADTNYRVAAVADFNGDGKSDLFWRNETNGQNSIWLMDGFTPVNGSGIQGILAPNWYFFGTGDFNGDLRSDLVWRNDTTGETVIWQIDGFSANGSPIPTIPDTRWRLQAIGDFDGDGKDDLFWRNPPTGENVIWLLNGWTVVNGSHVPGIGDSRWQVVAPR